MPTDWKDTSYDSLLVVVNRLTKISKPAQKIDATRFPRLDRPQLRLLVSPVPLWSLTAVTTYASSMRISRNLMTACRNNLQCWLVT